MHGVGASNTIMQIVEYQLINGRHLFDASNFYVVVLLICNHLIVSLWRQEYCPSCAVNQKEFYCKFKIHLMNAPLKTGSDVYCKKSIVMLMKN